MTVPTPVEHRGKLAIALQEAFTSVTRLRANKQIATDAESFRTRIKQVLSTAEQEAKTAGYSSDYARYALFALIALLDETILNCGQAMFANWSLKPLQQEVFGVHMAGELFFQYLQQLLTLPDTPDLADLLEVYNLCLLLGFKGRYAASQGGDLHALSKQLTLRIDKARGKPAELSPRWRPSKADIGKRKDRWVPRLAVVAVSFTVIAVALFVFYSVKLRSGTSDLRTETARLAQ
ncbi:MAG: DotU family type IV/VI secretion system protein [Gemmatimonadaceae bacterium]